MTNVIPVDFSMLNVQITKDNVACFGTEKTKTSYIEAGLDPAYVRAIIKRAVRYMYTKRLTP